MQTGSEKTDVRELVDRIRRSLATRTPGQEEALAADLTEYSNLCVQANQRLRDCLGLIKKGQYANAVALADQEPALLDLCSDLDLPEREVLPVVATSLKIAPPEKINVSLVEGLQEAYIKGNTVAGNLRLLHKLTLAHAPLPARLAVMRRLLTQDTSHPYLEADIRQFEAAWFKRAMDYCRPFAKNGDAEMISMVLEDLKNSGYVETPPKTLISSLESLLSKARQLELPVLADKIRQAYQDQSVTQLQLLFDQWADLSSKAGVDPADPKFELAEASRWLRKALDDERKRVEEEQARTLLARHIQLRDVKRIDLENAYAIATAHGVVDELLESQYRSRLAEIIRRRSSIQIFAATGTLAVVALIAVGSYWFVQSRQHQNEVAKLLSELNSLAAAEKHEELIRQSEGATAAVASDQQIVSVVRTARDAITREVAFEKALTQIADCPVDGDIQPHVDQAHKLASKEDQRKRVDAAHDAWKERKAQQMLASRQEFDKNVGELVTTIDRWNKSQNWDAVAMAAEIKTMEESAAKLRDFARAHGLGEGSLPDAEKRLEQLSSRIGMMVKLTAFLEQQQKSSAAAPPLQEVSDFLSATLVAECRDVNLANRLKSAKADLFSWKSVQTLRDQLLQQTIDGNNRAWDGTPVAGVLSVCVRESQKAESRTFRRVGAKPASESVQLLERLTAPDMKDVVCVRTTGYNYPYYTHSDVAAEGPVEIKYLIDSKGVTLPLKLSGSRKVFPAPQSVYLEKVQPLFSGSWHTAMATAYSELVVDEEIDALLRLHLIDRFLDVMTSSSTGFSEVLESQPTYRTVFRSSRRVTGIWYRPEEEDKLEAVREEATRLCKSAPSLSKELAQRAEQRDTALAQIRKRAIGIVGLLAPDRSGAKVSLFSGAVLDHDGSLYVLTGGKWIEVGKVTGSDVTFNADAASHVGWPVIHVCKS